MDAASLVLEVTELAIAIPLGLNPIFKNSLTYLRTL